MADTQLTAPTVIPPRLDPLANSHEANEVEAELQAAFIEVFEATLRAQERAINSYGAPHRGPFETIERFVKADGLAMERANAEPYMAELFRAWRALNPKRGTIFLRYYLQLLFPNQWTVSQLWQDPGLTYPDDANEAEGPGKFLTSRIRVSLDLINGADLSQLVGSFRAVLPARFVLEVKVKTTFGNTLRMAGVMTLHKFQRYTGTAAP